jgi:hypothetical protein
VIPLGLKMIKAWSHFPSRQVIPLGLKMLQQLEGGRGAVAKRNRQAP